MPEKVLETILTIIDILSNILTFIFLNLPIRKICRPQQVKPVLYIKKGDIKYNILYLRKKVIQYITNLFILIFTNVQSTFSIINVLGDILFYLDPYICPCSRMLIESKFVYILLHRINYCTIFNKCTIKKLNYTRFNLGYYFK